MKKLIELFYKYKEIIMYLIMGCAATAVSWGSYGIFATILSFLPVGTTVLIANIISWIIAMFFAYFTNKVWVFNSRDWSRDFVIKEFLKFFSARAATGALEIFLVPFLVNIGFNATILGIEGMVSKVTVSIAVVILNYVFSKLFIFKDNSNS